MLVTTATDGLVMVADLLGRMGHRQPIDAVGHRQIAVFRPSQSTSSPMVTCLADSSRSASA